MAKIGRNDLCPLRQWQQAQEVLPGQGPALAHQTRAAAAPKPDQHGLSDDRYDEMVALSNGVLEHINDGKLDEAERAAHNLLERFPEVHDGFARLALVYEVRGENRQAVDYYLKVIAFVRGHADVYDPRSRTATRIDRLEPAETMGALPPCPRDI
jgi:hypothetical protein